jgi:hypothetical protein
MPRDHTTKEGPSLSIREIDIRYLYFCGRAPIERFTCLSRSLSGLKKHDIERSELDGERELIKEIMRFIGVLHDVKATEKSIAAGGRDSIKDAVSVWP